MVLACAVRHDGRSIVHGGRGGLGGVASRGRGDGIRALTVMFGLHASVLWLIRRPELRRRGQVRTPRRRVFYYYTFDHRRLVCMREAGFTKVRLRIKLFGRTFDEFANKSIGSLGKRRDVSIRMRS